MTDLLEVRDLHVAFRAGSARVQAVRGIDLDIKGGEILGIIGESGCGKTVTGLSLLRLLSDTAEVTAGELRFRGNSLTGLDDAAFRQLRGVHLAMVFQNPSGSFNPSKTIGWHLACAAGRAGLVLPKADAAARLAEVGIPSPARVLALYPHQLSGGMLQRALIALVLLLQPELIVADEPTTNLDTIVEGQILRILLEVRARTDAAIVFITHDMSVAAMLCDRIAVMYAGQIVETGPSAAIFGRPRHPYTAGLIEAAMQLERGAERLTEIPGERPSLTGEWRGCAFAPRCNRADAECVSAPPLLEATDPAHQVRCFHHD